MRGQKLFNELIKSETALASTGKGRNQELLAQRNECLIDRYYFFSRFTKKNYEEVLNRLMGEFFLTPDRIARVVQDHAAALKTHRQESTSVNVLQIKWPHLKWQIK